jgi:hypothetical protein
MSTQPEPPSEADSLAALAVRVIRLMRRARRQEETFNLLLGDVLDLHAKIEGGEGISMKDRRLLRHLAEAVRAVEVEEVKREVKG